MQSKKKLDMKMKRVVGFLFVMSLLILQACSAESTPPSQDETSIKESKEAIETAKNTTFQEVTLHIEQEINETVIDGYVFGGFIGEDTFVLTTDKGDNTFSYYHPAKIGYTFELKELRKVKSAEVLDFNRDEGYITLRLEFL